MPTMPSAEVDVDGDLVRELLRDQHSDLADLPIELVANGWDNSIFRLGDELTVRLPRRQMAAALVGHEQQVLPMLATRLPLAVPAPIRVGRPALGYPWSWSVTPWFDGTIAAEAVLNEPSAAARRIGEFLAALHVEPQSDDQASPPPNPYRGHFVGRNTQPFMERLEQLDESVLDRPAAIRRWNELVDVAPWAGPPVWLHADLHAANIIVAHGAVTAVVDWGDVCSGDPATDLSCAWALFDAEGRDELRTAACAAGRAIDDATWQRAEAWALHFCVMYLAHSADNPTMGAIGRRLASVLFEIEGGQAPAVV